MPALVACLGVVPRGGSIVVTDADEEGPAAAFGIKCVHVHLP